MDDPHERIVISDWRIEPCGDVQFWRCSLCPDATVVVRGEEDAWRLIDHQLACDGVPRNVAREIERRVRGRFPRRPHL